MFMRSLDEMHTGERVMAVFVSETTERISINFGIGNLHQHL
jgi:hypothetical protein